MPVKANELLKAGDILFRIDPQHYEYEVAQRRATLAEAEQNVSQLKAGFQSALAAAEAATAQRDTTKKAFDRFNEGNENARLAGRALPFSVADVENRRGAYLTAEGAMQAAVARAEQARITYQSQIDGVHTSVARLRAELWDAEYNLNLTTVRSPGLGFVTQLALRPGMYVVPAPFKPVMVFVNLDDRALAAGFQQNALLKIRPGDEAEVAFDAAPGQIFKGKVRNVIDVIATGQLQASGVLQDMGEEDRAAELWQSSTSVTTRLHINFQVGRQRQVALYTPYWHHFAIIRRILLRMRSWQNYVFLEGH